MAKSTWDNFATDLYTLMPEVEKIHIPEVTFIENGFRDFRSLVHMFRQASNSLAQIKVKKTKVQKIIQNIIILVQHEAQLKILTSDPNHIERSNGDFINMILRQKQDLLEINEEKLKNLEKIYVQAGELITSSLKKLAQVKQKTSILTEELGVELAKNLNKLNELFKSA